MIGVHLRISSLAPASKEKLIAYFLILFVCLIVYNVYILDI
jgi:hypothetical protein